MVDESPAIFVLSDATADTAERVLRAALIQFSAVSPEVRIFSLVRETERLREIVDLAAEAGALMVHTMANPDHRELLVGWAAERGVPAVDLIGHLMGQLAAFLGVVASGRPGIKKLGADYFRRIEAVEFAIQHDDGQMIANLHQADMVLVGLSRTSKTPLSTYLAQKGLKVANVPIVLGLPMPKELESIDQQRVFGLTIDMASLIRIRRSRLRSLNMPMDTDYARRDHVIREREYAADIFREHPTWPVVDVSQKAIEETAAILLRVMEERERVEDGEA